MKRLLACAAVALALSPLAVRPALAQSSMSESTAVAMSESKRALVRELLDLVNARVSPTAVMEASLAQMTSVMPRMLEQLTNSRTDLTPRQKAYVNSKSKEMMARFGARFREEMLRQIDFKQFQEDVSMELYDEFYTEDELRDIVAFYRTPTGQKTLSVAPQLAAESMRLGAERLGPQIGRIVQQLLEEELNEMTSPKPSRSARRN